MIHQVFCLPVANITNCLRWFIWIYKYQKQIAFKTYSCSCFNRVRFCWVNFSWPKGLNYFARFFFLWIQQHWIFVCTDDSNFLMRKNNDEVLRKANENTNLSYSELFFGLNDEDYNCYYGNMPLRDFFLHEQNTWCNFLLSKSSIRWMFSK